MYHLLNYMTGDCISSHRTLKGATDKQGKMQRALKRESPNSYLPLTVREGGKDLPKEYADWHVWGRDSRPAPGTQPDAE